MIFNNGLNPALPPPTPPAAPDRSLNLAASDPVGFAGQFGSAPANSDASMKFGQSLTQMLQKYQQLGNHATAQVGQGQLNYSDAGINAENTQLTDPKLRGYAPSTIMNAGATATKPYDTAAAGLAQQGQTFNEQLGNFGDILNNANSLLKDQQAAQEKAQSNAQGLIHDAMAIGSDALNSLLQNNPDLVKLSGYDTKTLQGFAANIKSKEDLAKQQFNYQHANSYNSGNNGPDSTPQYVVDDKTDATVQALIASNPGEWGHAADAIDKQFGAGTATKYDSWLKAVYQQGQSINDVAQPIQVGNYSPLTGSRYALQATRIAKNFIDLPIYQATANGQVYLSRIASAAQNPGSVGDAELLDSIVKLNTSGNAITNEQVQLITGYNSFGDKLNVLKNRLQNGGALSDAQRKELVDIAQNTFKSYKAGYQPVYNQVTTQLKAAGIPKAFWTIPDLNSLAAAGSTQSTQSNSSDDYNTYLKAIGK